jgi:transcriptional regulator with XRE-family HTH domain
MSTITRAGGQMIGEEVRRRREALGLTGAQLAARAGLAPSAVSQIETGRRNPNSASVIKLADGLGVEVGDLFPKAQSPLPLEESTAGAHLWEKVLDAARGDARKTSQAVNRAFASQGVPQTVTGFAEDEVRAEMRNLGFPDALWENLLWPLAERVIRLEEQLEAKEGKPEERLESHTHTRQ